MGGMVGMWMGANAPQRMNRIILSNTSAYFENKQIWNDRLAVVKEKGLGVIVQGTLERWFTKGFREREPAKVKAIGDMFLATKAEGYLGCGAAVRDMDHRPLLPKIKAPTMVIAGSQDAGTTPEMGEYVQKNIPGATLKMFDAAHIANIECAADYTAAMLDFLRR
jgi:3-oxoadipate enol-lactonase